MSGVRNREAPRVRTFGELVQPHIDPSIISPEIKRIGALANEGIEEALDELRGRETTALDSAARYDHEVQSLALLRNALKSALILTSCVSGCNAGGIRELA